jgi:hypothetical protein
MSIRENVASKLCLLVSLCLVSSALAGCGPSPTELCDHVAELEKAEGLKEMGKTACEMKVGFKKEKLGAIKWSSYGGCVKEAKSMADVEKCEPK